MDHPLRDEQELQQHMDSVLLDKVNKKVWVTLPWLLIDTTIMKVLNSKAGVRMSSRKPLFFQTLPVNDDLHLTHLKVHVFCLSSH